MKRHVQALIQDCRGNIAVTFCLLLVTLMTAVGMSIDYARAYNYRAEMQADLDIALLSAVKEVGTSDSAQIEAEIKNWFAAQSDLGGFTYKLGDLAIDATNHNLTASASLSVPTSLLSIANIDTIDLAVTSSVAGISASFLNVYVVIDKSASMLIAGTAADRDKMMAATKTLVACAFACHESIGSVTYNKKVYTNFYDLSVVLGVTLRSDIARGAIEGVLKLIETYDTNHTQIRIGLYTIGKTASEVLAPTYSTSTARTAVNDKAGKMSSASSDNASYFDVTLTSLKTLVGTAGNGKTATTPLKLVLLLTDGVQSQDTWLNTVALQKKITPLNPDWCTQIKSLGATVGVLYTEYLPLTHALYTASMGNTMASSNYKTDWKGTYDAKYGTTIRRDYIPVALAVCATNSSLFLKASSADEINTGLSKLFRQYFDKVRVTN